MTEKPDDKSGPDGELRGWPFVGSIAVAFGLGGAYVVWKHYKHHVLFPWLGPDMWIVYAIAVAGVLTWGIVTRFGTRKR